MVEKARDRLMLVCVSITSPPNRPVKAPTIASKSSATCESVTRGLRRMMRKPPALMIPACIRADTGVGASIVSGSQLWKGNCADLVIAPSTKRIPAAARHGSTGPPDRRSSSARAKMVAYSLEPKHQIVSPTAAMRKASPRRLIRNFLRAAQTAQGRSG